MGSFVGETAGNKMLRVLQLVMTPGRGENNLIMHSNPTISLTGLEMGHWSIWGGQQRMLSS